MAKGKKNCPECGTENGARTLCCSNCQYDFFGEKKAVLQEQIDPKKRKLYEEIEQLPLPEIKKLSPKEHAKRVLKLGKERASLLLKLAKTWKCWGHVDWSMVEKKLVGVHNSIG